jgi:PIN domain nuclease of toxin-antitoxin system
MRLLLDTHAFIWSLSDTDRLPKSVGEAIADTDNDVFVSSVSFWEISIKARNRRLAPIGREPSTLVVAAESMGFLPIPITPVDAATQGSLKGFALRPIRPNADLAGDIAKFDTGQRR